MNDDAAHIAQLTRDLEDAEASERKMTELNVRNRANYDTLRKEISNYATEIASELPDVARELRHRLAASWAAQWPAEDLA